MNNYTVVLIYPGKAGEGRDGTVVTEVRNCPTPTIAARRAKRGVVSGTNYDPEDCEIIAVFEGILDDLYEPALDNQEYEDKILKEGA